MLKRIALPLAGLLLAALMVLVSLASASGPDPVPQQQVQQLSCTTGPGGVCTVNHNLGVVPEGILLTPAIASGAASYTLTVVRDSATASTVRVRAADRTSSIVGRVIFFTMVVFRPGVAPPPPTSTTSPTTTTPTTTPPTSTPPPPPAAHPTPATTGVPAGTNLVTHNGDLQATTPGQVIDGLRITGALLVRAPNVTIRNSEIHGQVVNDYAGDPVWPFTISDSLVGPTQPGGDASFMFGIGVGNFTAERVHIRNFGDGIRAGQPNITVRDSYIRLETDNPDAHADGIQDYPRTQNLTFDHNTVDMSHLTSGFTAPIFVYSKPNEGGGSRDVRVTNNLVSGGVYSVYLWPFEGEWVVSGNRVVNNEWAFAPYDTNGLCADVDTWADNDVVTVDSGYRITGTVSDNVPCP